jgi:hypothetical protein
VRVSSQGEERKGLSSTQATSASFLTLALSFSPTLALSGRQGVWGGEGEGSWCPVDSRGLFGIVDNPC